MIICESHDYKVAIVNGGYSIKNIHNQNEVFFQGDDATDFEWELDGICETFPRINDIDLADKLASPYGEILKMNWHGALQRIGLIRVDI
jgi:hypothetical protein